MSNHNRETLTEIWLRKAKNNRIVAVLIILSIAIAGVSAFTESASKLYRALFPLDKREADTSASSTYTVKITILPTTVNHDARIKPHDVSLELHSGIGTQRIMTENFPITKTFVWSPTSGGDVTLLISIGDITLKKEYQGNLGFPEFLREFNSVNRVFRPNEFGVKQSAILKEYGVEFISVSFAIDGSEPLLRYLSR